MKLRPHYGYTVGGDSRKLTRMLFKRAVSPWAMPVNPQNQKKKLAYIQQQIDLLTRWAMFGMLPLWFDRKRWVEANQL